MKYLKMYSIFKESISTSVDVRLIDKDQLTYDFISQHLNVIGYDEYINNENLYQVGAFLEGVLIGIRIFRMKDGKIHLNYSAVLNEFRGQGINTIMYSKIEEIAIEMGVNIITSNVRESNKSSLNSLLKCGFSINDRVELTYPDGEKKIPLFKRL